MNKIFLGMIFLLLPACSSTSLDSYYKEGEEISGRLATKLEHVHSLDDLSYQAEDLKRLFEQLVETMMKASTYAKEHPKESGSKAQESVASKRLKEQLQRVYEIEGGRDLMEKIQKNALYRLDAFDDKRKKKVSF